MRHGPRHGAVAAGGSGVLGTTHSSLLIAASPSRTSLAVQLALAAVTACPPEVCALLFYAFVAGFSYGEVKCSVTNPVHNINTGLNYASIQEAIDAPETVNGHTILVDSGTYNTRLVVDKSLKIIGSGRNATVINGVGGFVVDVVANDVLIEGFSMKGGSGVI